MPTESYERQCAVCGEDFTAHSYDRKSCSEECSYILYSRASGTLTEEEVIQMRKAYWLDTVTYAELMDTYAVSRVTVVQVVGGHRYAHLWMPSEKQREARVRPKHDQRGEKGHTATLSDHQVLAMRELYATTEMTMPEVAQSLGIDRPKSTVRSAINGTTYGHLKSVEYFRMNQ